MSTEQKLREALAAIVRSAELHQSAVSTFLLIDAKEALAQSPAPEQQAPQEEAATIRTWHKNGYQHAELMNWGAALDNIPDGLHKVYLSPAAPEAASLSDFAKSQRPIPPDMGEILHGNLWDLYGTGDAPEAAKPETGHGTFRAWWERQGFHLDPNAAIWEHEMEACWNAALLSADAKVGAELCQRCAPVCRGGHGCFAGMPEATKVKMIGLEAHPPAVQKPLTGTTECVALDFADGEITAANREACGITGKDQQ